MKILCTDLEGTLAPEIWQEIGRNYNIPELSATTREIPDFEDLMNMRMEALENKAIKYSDLKNFLMTIDPYQGAKEFLNSLKDKYQIVIVSDTFYELALPLIEKLGDYPILCHHLNIKDDYIESYSKRQNDPKRNVVKGFKSMNYEFYFKCSKQVSRLKLRLELKSFLRTHIYIRLLWVINCRSI